MIKWAKIGSNIQMEQLEYIWTKGLKFTLLLFKKKFYKIMYCWYSAHEKLLERIKVFQMSMKGNFILGCF